MGSYALSVVTESISQTVHLVPTVDIALADLSFDESYNMREAIEFLSDRLGVRERLIQSARQFSEKNGSQKFGITVKRFEDLYSDFLKLYSPLIEKIAGHKEMIQKGISAQRDALTGIVGMVQVARGVDVLADRLRELETEAKGIEAAIAEKSKTIEKIDDLLNRARHQTQEVTKQVREDSIPEMSDQTDDFMLELREPTKSSAGRKTSGR